MRASAAAAARRMTLPRHVAIIMDGNGRWAAAPRPAAPCRPPGRASKPVRMCIVEDCAQRGIGALTLFAFRSENWGRPAEEVVALMELFVEALDREVDELHQNGVRVRFIGDRHGSRRAPAGSACGRRGAHRGQYRSCAVQVARRLRRPLGHRRRRRASSRERCASGALRPADIDRERRSAAACSSPGCPIRTSSSAPVASSASAISCCGTSPTPNCISATTLWPDFDAADFDAALQDFAGAPASLRTRPARRSAGG